MPRAQSPAAIRYFAPRALSAPRAQWWPSVSSRSRLSGAAAPSASSAVAPRVRSSPPGGPGRPQPLETLRGGGAVGLERGGDAGVQLAATGHEDVLVHALLEEPVTEPVIRPRRHEIGAGERVECRIH